MAGRMNFWWSSFQKRNSWWCCLENILVHNLAGMAYMGLTVAFLLGGIAVPPMDHDTCLRVPEALNPELFCICNPSCSFANSEFHIVRWSCTET
ncbi:hypothetical protein ZWY2020_041656 [Hordeum vulgare]|nr:hypothetical protein ZWY2020_041656 [Hordeum vulgare]